MEVYIFFSENVASLFRLQISISYFLPSVNKLLAQVGAFIRIESELNRSTKIERGVKQ